MNLAIFINTKFIRKTFIKQVYAKRNLHLSKFKINFYSKKS